jgi:hypothetical protein
VSFSTSIFKSYIRGLLIAVATILISWLIASETLIRLYVEPTDELKERVINYHTSKKADAAFGDSHTIAGLRSVDGVFNGAFPGEDLPSLLHKVKNYYRDRKVGTVLLQAEPQFLRWKSASDKERRYRAHFDADFDIADVQRGSSVRLLTPYYRQRLLHFWGTFLRREVQGRTARADGKVASWSELSPNERVWKARKRSRGFLPTPSVFDDDPEQIQVKWSATILWLKQRGGRICLIAYPVASEYADALEGPLSQTSAVFSRLATQHDVPYIDLTHHFADSLELFEDQDHVNVAGSIRIATIVKERCLGQHE